MTNKLQNTEHHSNSRPVLMVLQLSRVDSHFQSPSHPLPDISEVLKLGKAKRIVDSSLATANTTDSNNTPSEEDSILRSISNASSASRQPKVQLGGLAGASSEGRLLPQPRLSVPAGTPKKINGVVLHINHYAYAMNAWRSEPEMMSPEPLPATDINDMVEWGLKMTVNTRQL